MRKTYHTDLSDSEWARIKPYLPVPKAPRRPRVHPLREILNAIFYIVRSGCAWRLLQHDFPPWKTVHHYFRIWRLDGVGAAKYGAAPALAGTEGQKPPSSVLGWSTHSRLRRPGWAAKHEATTVGRRFVAESVICWWTRRDSCSGPLGP